MPSCSTAHSRSTSSSPATPPEANTGSFDRAAQQEVPLSALEVIQPKDGTLWRFMHDDLAALLTIAPDGTLSTYVYIGLFSTSEILRIDAKTGNVIKRIRVPGNNPYGLVTDKDGNVQADQNNLQSDELYTKRVARRMLQMTRHINTDWTAHVGATGVTCYTCHRGQPVPANIWFTNPGPPHAQGMAGNKAGQNMPAPAAGYASLPYDPFTPFLKEDNGIRVVSTTALPEGNRHSIKQTEWTYSLMMHMSKSLGVNCTYCHNSRSFSAWDQSSPARSTAWHGIRLVRDVNNTFLESLSGNFPPNRLGPLGDVPKTDCATCHQGAFKPLFGASMLTDYPELRGPGTPAATP